jgi:acyl-coenzyme A synthetase/AMP-(fatty) acid ligase
VHASHLRQGYDRLWATDFRANANPGWHRTGDVGHLDADGSLWVEGRLSHVIVTANGPVTPVGLEHRILTAPFVEQAAIVGVGPAGTAQLVAVIVLGAEKSAGQLLDAARTQELRRIAGCDLAAVLVRPSLPVDIRHNSKVDRTALATWAQEVLGGTGSV